MASVDVLRVHMFVGAVMCVLLSGWLILDVGVCMSFDLILGLRT